MSFSSIVRFLLTAPAILLSYTVHLSAQADAACKTNLSRQHNQDTAIDLNINWFDGAIKFEEDRFASIMRFEINNIVRGG